MNDQLRARIIIRHALCWSAAFITPPLVMAIVDGFTRETPSQSMIAIFSSMALMMIFAVSNAFLSSGLDSATKSDVQEDEKLA